MRHITACCENVFNIIHPIASIKMAYKAVYCVIFWFIWMEFWGCLKFKSLSDRHHPNWDACDLTPVQKCQIHLEIRQTSHKHTRTKEIREHFSLILSYPIEMMISKKRNEQALSLLVSPSPLPLSFTHALHQDLAKNEKYWKWKKIIKKHDRISKYFSSFIWWKVGANVIHEKTLK